MSRPLAKSRASQLSVHNWGDEPAAHPENDQVHREDVENAASEPCAAEAEVCDDDGLWVE